MRRFLLALASLFIVRPVLAQSAWVPIVALDNDAYDFWRQPAQRSDAEYTNGVHLSVATAGAPWWGKRIARGAGGCRDEVPTGGCLTTQLTLGQDLYTPRLDRVPYAVTNWQNERPFFAWLFVAAEGDVISSRSLRTYSISIGVTGPPAGGELAQRIAHEINRGFTRPVSGWNTQIGFEPGANLGARWSVLAVRVHGGNGLGFDFAPSAGAQVGNILTEADAGGTLRLGWNLSHPWDPRRSGAGAPYEFWVLAGGRGMLVARDMSLDGTLFDASRKVERAPGVTEYRFGAGVRIWRATFSYAAVTRSREYSTGPLHHAYSELLGSLSVLP